MPGYESRPHRPPNALADRLAALGSSAAHYACFTSRSAARPSEPPRFGLDAAELAAAKAEGKPRAGPTTAEAAPIPEGAAQDSRTAKPGESDPEPTGRARAGRGGVMTNYGARVIMGLPTMPERQLRFLLALET